MLYLYNDNNSGVFMNTFSLFMSITPVIMNHSSIERYMTLGKMEGRTKLTVLPLHVFNLSYHSVDVSVSFSLAQ